MHPHLIGLRSVGFFQCPHVSEVKPALISEGTESVEILTGGKLRFSTNGEESVFTRGTVFWHQFGEQTICKTFADDPYSCFVLSFNVRGTPRQGPRVSIWSSPDETVAFASECHHAFHSGLADLEALANYAYSMIRWKAFSYAIYHPPQCPRLLLVACDFMEQNLRKPLTSEIIAAQAGISKPHLFHLFKTHLKKTPMHYLQEIRISQAKARLTETGGASIKAIAQDCGFGQLEVFYRQFKKQVGMTPAAYRNQYAVPLVY